MKTYEKGNQYHRKTREKAIESYEACLIEWLSRKEHKADALALGAEEGRDKMRKATVRSKYPSTRRCPNEGTHMW